MAKPKSVVSNMVSIRIHDHCLESYIDLSKDLICKSRRVGTAYRNDHSRGAIFLFSYTRILYAIYII